MCDEYYAWGDRLGLAHHPLSHITAVFSFFGLAWSLTTYLGGLDISPYYVNIIMMVGGFTLSLVGLGLAFGMWCVRTRGRRGTDKAAAQDAAYAADKFQNIIGIIAFGVGSIAVICIYALVAINAADAAYTGHNLTATVYDNTTLVLYQYSQQTDVLSLGIYIAVLTAYFAAILTSSSPYLSERLFAQLIANKDMLNEMLRGTDLTSVEMTGMAAGVPLLDHANTKKPTMGSKFSVVV